MKERPILFSAPMVRAILDGRKTQTRRIMKPQPEKVGDGYLRPLLTDCPYGWKGDLLWVRETCAFSRLYDFHSPRSVPCNTEVRYAADFDDDPEWMNHAKVRPSIFMPKWASRIWLEVTGIRVERLQDISNQDAVSEGVGTPTDIRYAVEDCFRPLWESINGKGSWSENPWVWVVEFQRTDQAKAA